jgi:hypothetical protein
VTILGKVTMKRLINLLILNLILLNVALIEAKSYHKLLWSIPSYGRINCIAWNEDSTKIILSNLDAIYILDSKNYTVLNRFILKKGLNISKIIVDKSGDFYYLFYYNQGTFGIYKIASADNSIVSLNAQNDYINHFRIEHTETRDTFFISTYLYHKPVANESPHVHRTVYLLDGINSKMAPIIKEEERRVSGLYDFGRFQMLYSDKNNILYVGKRKVNWDKMVKGQNPYENFISIYDVKKGEFTLSYEEDRRNSDLIYLKMTNAQDKLYYYFADNGQIPDNNIKILNPLTLKLEDSVSVPPNAINIKSYCNYEAKINGTSDYLTIKSCKDSANIKSLIMYKVEFPSWELLDSFKIKNEDNLIDFDWDYDKYLIYEKNNYILKDRNKPVTENIYVFGNLLTSSDQFEFDNKYIIYLNNELNLINSATGEFKAVPKFGCLNYHLNEAAGKLLFRTDHDKYEYIELDSLFTSSKLKPLIEINNLIKDTYCTEIFDRDNNDVYINSDYKTIYRYNLKDNNLSDLQTGDARLIGLSNNSNDIISGNNGSIRLINIKSKNEIIYDYLIHDSGSFYATNNTEHIFYKCYSQIHSLNLNSELIMAYHSYTDGYAAMIPMNRKPILIVAWYDTVKFFNIYTGKEIYRFNIPPVGISRISISKDNSTLLVKSYSFFLHAYDISEISSIKENYIEFNNMSLSPNPATDYIEIDMNDVVLSEAKNPRIFDLLGVEITTPNLTPTLSEGEGVVRLDVSSLSPGVYFVRIGDVVRKFVKL